MAVKRLRKAKSKSSARRKRRNPTMIANPARKRRKASAKRKRRNPVHARTAAPKRRRRRNPIAAAPKRRRRRNPASGDLQTMLLHAAGGAAIAIAVGAAVGQVKFVQDFKDKNPLVGDMLPGLSALGLGLAGHKFLKNPMAKKLSLYTAVAGGVFAVKAAAEKSIEKGVASLFPAKAGQKKLGADGKPVGGYQVLGAFSHDPSAFAGAGYTDMHGNYMVDQGQGVFSGY